MKPERCCWSTPTRATLQTPARLKAFLVSYPVRKAQKECLKVTAMLKATARQLQATHQLSVETPTKFALGPQDTQEVELLLHSYVEGLLAADKLATARKLRNRFKTLHWNAGGWPADLTNAINSCLLEFAMRDGLAPTKSRGVLSLQLFSGGQSDHSPADLVGLTPRCLAQCLHDLINKLCVHLITRVCVRVVE